MMVPYNTNDVISTTKTWCRITTRTMLSQPRKYDATLQDTRCYPNHENMMPHYNTNDVISTTKTWCHTTKRTDLFTTMKTLCHTNIISHSIVQHPHIYIGNPIIMAWINTSKCISTLWTWCHNAKKQNSSFIKRLSMTTNFK